MRNIKIVVQYDGTRYSGWQSQEHDENTIQGKLTAVLSRLLGEKIELAGSGRTDAGVHALGQVANFKTRSQMPCGELLEKLNIPESSLQVTARLNDQESIKNLVANGLGISVISKAAACSPGSDQKLLVFDLPMVADSRSLYLVYHKNFILKPYVHHFMEFVINFYTRSRY